MTGRQRRRSPGGIPGHGPVEHAPAIPAPLPVGDAAHIPCEVYQVMHLPGSADMEGCGPCEGGVQEIEFANRVTRVVIS